MTAQDRRGFPGSGLVGDQIEAGQAGPGVTLQAHRCPRDRTIGAGDGPGQTGRAPFDRRRRGLTHIRRRAGGDAGDLGPSVGCVGNEVGRGPSRSELDIEVEAAQVQVGANPIIDPVGIDHGMPIDPNQPEAEQKAGPKENLDENHAGPVGEKWKELSLWAQLLPSSFVLLV